MGFYDNSKEERDRISNEILRLVKNHMSKQRNILENILITNFSSKKFNCPNHNFIKVGAFFVYDTDIYNGMPLYIKNVH